jgi:hypothetical protein
MTDEKNVCPNCSAPITGPGKCKYCGADLSRFYATASPTTSSPLEDNPVVFQQICDLVAKGQKIGAIKLVREHTGMGLRESKELVESGKFGMMGGAPGNSGSDACFPGWVKVQTPRGPLPISTIKEGDVVCTWDTENRHLRSAAVYRRIAHSPVCIWEIVFENAQSIFTTSHHCFLTERGWKKTKDLTYGASLVDTSTNHARSVKSRRIASVRRTAMVAPVYNIHVEGEFNFIIDGIPAHSFSRFRQLRMSWRRIFNGMPAMIQRVIFSDAPAK